MQILKTAELQNVII